MYALTLPSWIPILCGKYAAANAHSDEAVALAEEKGSLMWKALGTVARGCVLALTSKASDAVQMINDGITVDQHSGCLGTYQTWPEHSLDEGRSWMKQSILDKDKLERRLG